MIMLISFLATAITLILPLFLYAFYQTLYLKTPAFTNWPFVGMLPRFLWNVSHIHDFQVQLLKSKGGTVEFLGPWFTKMKAVITADPQNVHHIMSKSFDNFVKGDLFREMFQAFGEGIFTTDSIHWKYHRNLLQYLFKQRSFEAFQEKVIHDKVEKSLIPLLNHVVLVQQQKESMVDLQDIFNRFTFDNICLIVLGNDPNCLSIDFPEIAVEKAFNQAEESIFYRHTVPGFVWRLQRWLQIREEKKMTEACKVFDKFLYDCIASKREELLKNCNKNEDDAQTEKNHHVDLLTAMIGEEKSKGNECGDKFLRDLAFNLFVAGRDTITSALTWLFYLIAAHPLVENNILKEIKENFGHKEKPWVLSVNETKKLVYLHGAICEALRLFPPVPFERKEAIKADILPSGHHVYPNKMIFFSLYAMGRFEDIWGKDCLEFKPERWISERGGNIYVPSYKFFSFNAGPRTCLGRDLAFLQVKMVTASILWNYCVHVKEGSCVTPSLSIVLLTKEGLNVKITKRKS